MVSKNDVQVSGALFGFTWLVLGFIMWRNISSLELIDTALFGTVGILTFFLMLRAVGFR